MTLDTLDHWHGRAIDFLAIHLPKARRQIRVATGFFTVQGYNLIRRHVLGKHIKVMVGFDETAHEQLKQKLIEDIMQHLSRWNESNRRDAVLDLVTKLQRGEFQISEQATPQIIDARIRHRDHGKVYIIDDQLVLSGSANLTVNGLLYNAENLAAVHEPDRVEKWCTWFEEYWWASDTQDLTQALLDMLLGWLELRTPYDVYLKTIQALVTEDQLQAPREAYKMPVAYQRVVIERVLRQLKEWRGAMIVASTGLGKTVMATHTALRLFSEGRILNVLVFAPVQIHSDWKRAFKTAGVNASVFTRNLLDQPERGAAVREIVDALDDVDKKTLIILDETQYFVNRLRSSEPGDRLSFSRLVDVANLKDPYVLMLTATPMVKSVEDLNNQLRLLPHTAPLDTPNAKGQGYLLSPNERWSGRPWVVQDQTEFFEQFMDIPVVTVISTSYVAKTFAEHTEQGDYLEFGSERRWIPQIELRKIYVSLPIEQTMSHALDSRYFKHKKVSFIHRGNWRQSESTIEKEAAVAWASSPKALADILRDTIDDTYQVSFIRSADHRRQALTPILNQLENQPLAQDEKFIRLCTCLEIAKNEGRKVIIFTERLATCVYLEQKLPLIMPDLRIACVVRETNKGYEQKNPDEVDELILDFAPEANKEHIRGTRQGRQYDVFITTDAYGVGVNLQDASVVLNYDIAWTPDTIIQRAGRILRFWREPRRVQFLVFIGVLKENREHGEASRRVERRLEKLTARSRQAERFSELPMLPDNEVTEIKSLAPLSSVEVVGMVEVSEIEEFTGVSRFLRHITERNRNREYADSIPDDISSAMVYHGNRHLLYLLLRYRKEYHWMFYDVRSKQIETIKEDALLDMLQCDEQTPIANVDPNQIEYLAQECKSRWCKSNLVEDPDEVERICALYLMPRTDKSEFATMMKDHLHHDS